MSSNVASPAISHGRGAAHHAERELVHQHPDDQPDPGPEHGKDPGELGTPEAMVGGHGFLSSPCAAGAGSTTDVKTPSRPVTARPATTSAITTTSATLAVHRSSTTKK